ncbi:hypothetical protein IPZ58_37015 [Streptomyces roseoverticillatus]|uniref:hypothetical protein n=1 Tax=Streptomyces roseoverticillatus TaxID=66429 RepID=UPI001F2C88BC|nr:hypothetical protein [Streptomyces roseoverticillatus]MCF3107112.1 hypothetical protein [Streptomyces roseoverticillatus]
MSGTSVAIEMSGASRITVFPLEGHTVGYTNQSSDGRGLGDIAVIGVIDPTGTGGETLWRLAREFCRARDLPDDHARWIITQASRVRMTGSYEPPGRWTATISRRYELPSLFSNHGVLLTGVITLARGMPSSGAREGRGSSAARSHPGAG